MRRILVILPAALALMGARSAEPGAAADAAIVSMEPFSVPIVDGGRVQGMLDVKLALRAAATDASELDSAMPGLRAAVRSAVAEHARLYASPWQAVDAAALTGALDKAAAVSSPVATTVLVTEVRARRS